MGSVSRNAPCPGASARKVKRCCGNVTPAGVGRTHDAELGDLIDRTVTSLRFGDDPDRIARAMCAASRARGLRPGCW
jgi:hypothetical protein